MPICHDFYITTFSKASRQYSCVYIQSQIHVMVCSTYLWWVTAQKNFGGKTLADGLLYMANQLAKICWWMKLWQSGYMNWPSFLSSNFCAITIAIGLSADNTISCPLTHSRGYSVTFPALLTELLLIVHV